MTKLTLVVLNVLLIIFQITALVLSRSSSECVSHLDDDDDIIDLSEYGDAIFGEPDFETTGKRVAAYNPNTTLSNPDELGTYFQGDILFPIGNGQRNGLLNLSRRWCRAIVPYVIEGDFTEKELDIIENAFKEYHNRTCVRFTIRTTETDYISIRNSESGCFSYIGCIRGMQVVNLQTPSCVTHGVVLHELMHAIGFLHEHTRHDRDKYIKVLSQNIHTNYTSNFDMSNSTYSDSFGVKYDYNSIMHYSADAFSSNLEPTLMPLEENLSVPIGQREKLSEGDIKKINAMYKCNQSKKFN